jgi:hypothetical protein
MQRQLSNITCLLLLCLGGAWLAAAPAAAETYKWKDADGKIHYSDQPPPPSAKGEVTVTPGKKSEPAKNPGSAQKEPPAAKAKTYKEQEAEFKKRQVEAAEREAADKKKAAEAAEKKQNCEAAQAQLRGLQAGGRMTQTNAQGERDYMSDDQIAKEIERAKKAADSWCK